MEWFGQDPGVKTYIEAVRKAFPRNIRDNLSAMDKAMREISREAMTEAMSCHLDASMPGVNGMLQTARNIEKRNGTPAVIAEMALHTLTPMPDLIPEKTSMTNYSIFFN